MNQNLLIASRFCWFSNPDFSRFFDQKGCVHPGNLKKGHPSIVGSKNEELSCESEKLRVGTSWKCLAGFWSAMTGGLSASCFLSPGRTGSYRSFWFFFADFLESTRGYG